MSQNMGLEFATARGAIAIASSLEYQDMLRAVGFQDSEWKLLTQNQIWVNKSRPTLERLLKQLVFSALDLAGAPRIDVPAEFVAGVLVSYVSAPNLQIAAHYIGRYGRAKELGNYDGSLTGPVDGLERCTPAQLYALMCRLYSDEHCKQLNRRFNDKAVTSIERMAIDEEEITEKPAASKNKSS